MRPHKVKRKGDWTTHQPHGFPCTWRLYQTKVTTVNPELPGPTKWSLSERLASQTRSFSSAHAEKQERNGHLWLQHLKVMEMKLKMRGLFLSLDRTKGFSIIFQLQRKDHPENTIRPNLGETCTGMIEMLIPSSQKTNKVEIHMPRVYVQLGKLTSAWNIFSVLCILIRAGE